MKISVMRGAAVAALAFAVSPLAHAQSGAPATLRVEVRPEAALQVSAPLAWSGSGELSLPLDVTLRLQPASYSTLMVIRDTGMADGALQVETPLGWMPLSSAAVVVRSYEQSGRYPASLNVRAAPGQAVPAQPVTLLLRLTASDGSFDISRAVVIPAPAPAPPEPMLLSRAE